MGESWKALAVMIKNSQKQKSETYLTNNGTTQLILVDRNWTKFDYE